MNVKSCLLYDFLPGTLRWAAPELLSGNRGPSCLGVAGRWIKMDFPSWATCTSYEVDPEFLNRFWSTAQVDDFDLLSLKNLMNHVNHCFQWQFWKVCFFLETWNTKDKCWHLQLGSIDVFHYYHSTTLFRSLWLSFGWFGDGAPECRFFISWSIFFWGWGLCKAWKTLLKNHVNMCRWRFWWRMNMWMLYT